MEAGHQSVAITYCIGDATCPSGNGQKVIVHICNDLGKWGKGFVLALSRRWQEPESIYRQAFNAIPAPVLGDVQFVRVDSEITVANLIGQHGIARGRQGAVPVRYPAIQQGLKVIAQYACAHNATIHMPRIGCGLAGGSWDKIEPILEETLLTEGLAVFVYDLPDKIH